MASTVIAVLSWDPQIRGFLIVLTAFIILPGSVYLLLATNTGAKVGFLLAVAGLTGWMATMGWVWVVYGIGIKGHPPTWHVQEVVTGDVVALSTVDDLRGFPRGWQELKPGDSVLGDATASADKVLAPSTTTDTHGGAAAASTARPIEPVFESLQDYTLVKAYRTGGENCWLPGGKVCTKTKVGNDGSNPFEKILNRLKRGPFHAPHHVVLQVRPVIDQPTIAGAPAKPAPDPSAPDTSVVMVRDLGNLRFPSTMFAIAFSIVFAVVVSALHRRDKQIMALRATPARA
jgi:hypothetical protein